MYMVDFPRDAEQEMRGRRINLNAHWYDRVTMKTGLVWMSKLTHSYMELVFENDVEESLMQFESVHMYRSREAER